MKLYFEETGRGQPVVLVHGFPLDHTIFNDTAALLANSARVLMPDLRGFGLSQSTGVVSLPNMAGDICQLLDRLNIEKAVLAGHSMGGYLSLEFCRLYPERVKGLVLIASHASGDSEEQRQARLKNIERIRRGEARIYMLEGMLPKLTKYEWLAEKLAEIMIQTPAETLIEALESMAGREPAADWLTGSGIPVGMICGEEDLILPVAQAVELAAGLGAEPFIRVPSAGHMLMMENPAVTAEGLKEFLSRISS